MQTFLKLIVVLVTLSLIGWLRMPVEQQITNQLKAAHILTPSFDMESRASLSQKGFVASFGSLRPTMAAFTVLASASHHSRSEWAALEDDFESAVLLDPYNEYYWDLGAWHMAYNAATSSKDNAELAPLTREKLFKEYIQKGSNFYDRGIAANPQSWNLRKEKARLWSSPHRIEDFPLVAETLEDALEVEGLPAHQRRRFRSDLFYTLLRIPERVNDAYELGREIYDEGPSSRFPSLLNGLCALQQHPRMDVDKPLTLPQLYGSRQLAVKYLSNYLSDRDEHKPRYGVVEVLERLKAVDNQ